MLFILNKSYEVVGTLNSKGDLSKITTYFDDKYTQDLGTGAETFQFSVAANSTQAQHLVSGNFVAFKEKGEFKLFNIINIEETHEEIFMKEVYCEMASIELINKIIRPMEVLNSSLRKFLESILEDTEWQLGKMDIGFTQVYDFKVTDYKSVYELIQEYAVGTYGAEISYRVEIENGVVVGKYIDCYAERGKDNGFRFYYGSNLSSVVKTVDSSNLATALIGVGKNGLTFKSVEAPDKPLNSDFIANETAFEQWNVNGNHIFGVYNADTESPQELLRLTRIALEERANPQIKYEMKAELLGKNVGIGDTVYVVDHEFNPPLHLSARVNQLITSKTDPNSNEVVLANFKEVNSNITEEMRSLASQLEGYVDSQFPIGGDKIQDGAIGKQQFSKEYHTELIADAVYASLVETEELIAGKADIGDLTAINAKIENLKVEKADVTELHAQKAEIEELVATKADIGQLNATNAQIENLKANKADISDLHATNATIGELQANKADIGELNAVKGEINHLKSEVAEIGVIKGDVADIEHILAGNITADNIQTGAITAGSGIIADGAIGSAQISSLDAGKISAGIVDTSKVTIQGTNGHLRLKGNRMQVFDGVGNQAKERVSVGDVNGDGSIYGLRVRGADGQTVLLDENGVKSEGITDGAITNDKISDDANIDGAKININSVVSKINEDGTETIQGTKIEVDGTTLNTKLSSITMKQTEDGERISQAQSQISANTNAIKFKVDEQTYTTDKNAMNSKLEKNTSEISTMKGQIALKVEQTDIENAKSEMEGAIDTKIDSAKAEIKVTTDAISQNVSNLSQTVSTKADGSTVTAINNKVGSLETSVNGITGKVTNLEKTTTTLGTQVSNAQDSADSAINKANNAQSTANTANNTANANKNNITNLQGEVSTVKSDIASLEVTTSGISQKVSSVESTTATLTTKVTDAQNTANSAQSTANSANSSATNALNTANNTNSKVDNMQIGGRNLLLNSGNFKNTSHWSLNGGSNLRVETKDGFSCLSATGSVKHSVIKLEPSTTYMYWTEIMFNADISVTNSVPLHYWVKSMPSKTSRGTVAVVSGSGTAKANKWHKIVLKIDTGTLVSGDTHIELTPFIYRGSMTESWWLKYIQVEKGTKPSDWKPAPEDIDSSISAVDGKVTTLQGTVNTTNSKVATLETNLNGITQRVSSTESTTATLTTKVNTVEGTANTAKSTADSAKTTATNAQNTANSANSNATNALNKANDANSKIDRLEIGSRNILLGTAIQDTSKGNARESVVDTGNTFKDCKVWKSNSAWADIGFYFSTQIINRNVLNVGDTVTYSIYAKTDDTNLSSFPVYAFGGKQNSENGSAVYYFQAVTVGVLTNEWKQYSYTWTITADMMNKQGNPLNSIRFETNKANTSGKYVYWTCPKLEIGNKATDWTPAPEDVQSQIDTHTTQITTTNNKVSTIETNLSSITSRVGTVESKQTTTDGKVTGLESRMSNAESKITESAITNTVKKNFYTKSETDNQITSKGYQTASQVQQTVNGLQVKVQESGGYNLIYNGDFRRNDASWTVDNRANMTFSQSGLTCPNGRGVKMNGALKTSTSVSQYVLNVGQISESITASYYTYVSSSGADGTTNAYRAGELVLGYTDGTNTWHDLGNVSKFDTWEKRTITVKPTKRVNNIKIGLYNRDTTRVVYYSAVMIEKGALVNEWTPNPNEVYDGITTIDKDGITVTASNSNTYTQIDSESFRVEDNNGGTVAEFSRESSIPNLTAGIITANEIYAGNVCSKSSKSEDIKFIYVNGSTGNDNNAGTQANPYKTVQRAIDDIKDKQDQSVTIYVYNSVPGFNLKGITGAGIITLSLQDSAVINGYVILGGVTNSIKITNESGSLKATFKNGISIYRCVNVDIYGVTFRGTNAQGNNIYIQDTNYCAVNSCDLGGLSSQLLCAIRVQSSLLWLHGCKGSNITDVVGQYAFSHVMMARGGTSNVPDYSNGLLVNYDGSGRIQNWAGGTFTKTPSSGWNPSYTPTQKTQTWSFNKIWSDETLNGWSDKQELIQGYASTWSTGRWTGYMQFTDSMSTIRSAISGGTNLSGRLYVQRRTSSGNSTGSKLCLYASDGTLITNSTTINRGQGVWVNLSSAIISKIASGAITYFYLKADSNNTATYFKCESNPKIEITYTK